MCGLLGFDLRRAGLQKEQKAVMTAVLAIGNDHRGGDSYGWFDFNTTTRGLGELAEHALDMFRANFVMAHTRKATQGTVSVDNAHPFECGNIIGAHNGVISNHHSLNTKYKRECTVDSQHIFHHLNEGKSLEEISGYGVITWVQKTDPRRRVYLCKLGNGELAIYGIGKDHETCRGVIWSSDDDHIKAAVGAAHIEGFFYKVEPNKVYYVENGTLYEDGRKFEINKDTSRDWRKGYEGMDYSNWYAKSRFEGTVSDITDLSSEIVEDPELDKVIAQFELEEVERKKADEAKIVESEAIGPKPEPKVEVESKETALTLATPDPSIKFDKENKEWYRELPNGGRQIIREQSSNILEQ